MRAPTWQTVGLVLAGFILATFPYVAASVETPPLLAQVKSLPPQVNKEGRVSVKVTPLSIAPDAWRFKVELNTHSVALDQDLAAVSILVDKRGGEQRPLAWEGDPLGGHHRKGVLAFKPTGALPAEVTLKIRNVGPVPERAFTWKLGAP